ncbi:MAG TPA: phasin family protein [Paracoccaceae bacterium]|nr:phasin family protein [Paracoccaceae bacterium]
MATPKTDIVKETTDVMKEATLRVEAFAADTQKTLTAQMQKLTKGLETATAFNQETVDAMIKSSEIATKALEGLNAELVGYTKKAFEDGVAAAKDFASAKNVSELFEKQTDFAKTSMDSFMKQAAKVNELCMAAAKSTVEPINARFTAATEVFKAFAA